MNPGEVNLINRFIAPISHRQERFPGEDIEAGLGNLAYQAFLTPAQPGNTRGYRTRPMGR